MCFGDFVSEIDKYNIDMLYFDDINKKNKVESKLINPKIQFYPSLIKKLKNAFIVYQT